MATQKILIVDDDPIIRDLVASVLQAEGYAVETAEDGKQGVERVEQCSTDEKFTAIILDVCMPEMNGLDVATRLKLRPESQDIPVMMLTGEDKAEDIMAGYSVGADYYITKPFTRQQLLFGMNMLLSESD
ncbi:MAG: response regulator [Bdellovibrionales bacterium]|nr:response regulator [Bdellovibrionales bacterium]